jgi:hypothetical protein
MVLASRCRDEGVSAILRGNAEETLGIGAATALTTGIGA